MIDLLAFLACFGVAMGCAFWLGRDQGRESWLAEVVRVRAEAAVAERELHALTREAFVAMAEEAERRSSTPEH